MIYDAVVTSIVFSSPCMKCEAIQEFTYYTYAISIPALWSQRIKEMLLYLSPREQISPMNCG